MTVPHSAGDGGVEPDAELPAVHAQLVVFARELGGLYKAERLRSRELEDGARRRPGDVRGHDDVARPGRGGQGQRPRAATSIARSATASRWPQRVDPELAARPEVAYGFFLHDIGKVGIPESVLCKPGPLTDDEWDDHADPPGDRSPDRGADPVPRRRGRDRPHPPRALGRAPAIPPGLARRADPARGPGLRDRRFVRRDDERPPLPRGAVRSSEALEEIRARCRDAVRPDGRRAPSSSWSRTTAIAPELG